MAKQKKSQTASAGAPRRQRRSIDQQIADLAAKIEAIKQREARKQARADPALRHAAAAVKAIDRALDATEDSRLARALKEARAALGPCLAESGVASSPAAGRRSGPARADLSRALLEHVRKHPGQRGEQIAAALGTDSGTLRPLMKKLIAAGEVTTEGQRRGMTYSAT